MLVVVEGVALSDVGRNATDGEVHARQLEGGVGVFLTINAHILLVAMVGLHKLHRLNKHTTGTTARVIECTVKGFNHSSDKLNNIMRSVKFSFFFRCIQKINMETMQASLQ